MVVPVWFDEPQFSPSIIKNKNKPKNKITVNGYEADLENTEKILPPSSKKPRKSKQINLISEQETSNTSISSEADDNHILSVIQEEEFSLFSESNEWEHLSEFENVISDSSANDLLP